MLVISARLATCRFVLLLLLTPCRMRCAYPAYRQRQVKVGRISKAHPAAIRRQLVQIDKTPADSPMRYHMYMKMLRRQQTHMARCGSALLALLLLSATVSPCLQAMNAGHDAHQQAAQHAQHDSEQHACQHCPPAACAAAQADQMLSHCDQPTQVLALFFDHDQHELLAPAIADWSIAYIPARTIRPDRLPRALDRFGPRRHLLHAKFNE